MSYCNVMEQIVEVSLTQVKPNMKQMMKLTVNTGEQFLYQVYSKVVHKIP